MRPPRPRLPISAWGCTCSSTSSGRGQGHFIRFEGVVEYSGVSGGDAQEEAMVKTMPQAPPGPPGSLAAALGAVPDPRRRYGWRPAYAPVPLVALLPATVVAVLCGARSLYAVAQWIGERAEDEPEVLEALGFPAGRRTCVATLHRVYKALDVAAFEAAVGGWLRQTGVAGDDP